MESLLDVGHGGLARLSLQSPDGACAEIYCQGAHISAWRTADGEEKLFTSASSEYREGAAIRGGVPIIFPQFAALGPLPKHGFARTAPWRCVSVSKNERATAVFQLQDNSNSRSVWPHAFSAMYEVRVGARTLTMSLTVRNTGLTALRFTVALHTYLRIDDVHDVAVRGLQGLRYLDTVINDAQERIETTAELRVDGELDRIYFNASQPIAVLDRTHRLVVEQEGFKDVVVWNPGAARGAALKDLQPDGYRKMLCVEAATVGCPVELEPGASWSGRQMLTSGTTE